jgi:hypothetical protein
MHRLLVALMMFLLFSGCTDIHMAESNRETANEEQWRIEAISFADSHTLPDYNFLGVELFKPYTPPPGFSPGISGKGLHVFISPNEDGPFSKRVIGVDENRIAISVTGVQVFQSKADAESFMASLIDALKPRFPYLKGADDVFSVRFGSRESFISGYVQHRKLAKYNLDNARSAELEERLNNVQPDDKLSDLIIVAAEQSGQWRVVFSVASVESENLADEVQKQKKEALAKQILGGYNSKVTSPRKAQ